MKKVSVVLFFMWSVFCISQITKSVYFVGNSYIATNNLPYLIQQVAASTGDELIYQAHTPGGSNFQQHANNSTVSNTIALGNWDYVVLQQQSQMPAFPNATATIMYAQQLSTLIRNSNACSTPLFFMTWGHKNGDAINCANGVNYLCTYEGMDDKLYERYMQMTNENNAVVSPVGRVWREIRTQHPSYELYSPDGSHPSLLGSMAAAYTFYTIIYRKDPTLVTFNSTLENTTAENIKNIVKNIVYNQLEIWKVGINDVLTNFSFQLVDGYTIQFVNETENATEFLWDFGDGNTSTEENPIHTYSTNQPYVVTLTTNVCTTSKRAKNLDLPMLNNSLFFKDTVVIYPNPATDILYFSDMDFDEIFVFDATGKFYPIEINRNKESVSLDIHTLPNGVYFLKILKNKTQYNMFFIKK